MRVFICQFFDEDKMEGRVNRLVTREKKRAGDNLRVFCAEEQFQKRLEIAGTASNVLHGFWQNADMEANYHKAYELSDELHSSAENDDSLKYHNVNLLTFEYDLSLYVRAAELSKLCQQMVKQDCEVLILVLNKQISWYPTNINTPEIKTIKYGAPGKYQNMMRMSRHALSLGYLSLKAIFSLAKRYLKRPAKKEASSHIQEIEQGSQNALFIVSQPLYARPARSICSECQRNGITPYVAPYDSNLVPLLQKYNMEYANSTRLSSLVPFALELVKALPLFYRLRRHINSFSYDSKSNNANSDALFSATNIFKNVLQDELWHLCFIAIYSVLFTERMISSTAPAILCLMPDGYFPQQMAAATAKKHNIPTLACSAALETGNPRSYMKHLHADKIAAMGKVIKNIYIDSELEPERIVVTGVAHFDGLFNRDKEQDKQILVEHGIDPSKRIIVFGTENLLLSETVQALTGVIEAVLKMEDIQLVVKVHPSEGIEPYQAAVEQYHDPRIHVAKDIDLYSLLSQCELLIVKFSTIALEAMMIDKTVVVINLPGQPTPVPYAEEGAALGVYRYEDIEPAIQKVLYNEETRARLKAGRDKFVRAWAGEPDGKASQRIVNLMKEMIEANKIGKG